MKNITNLLVVFTLIISLFVSCKKDKEEEVATGTASAQLSIGSAAAITWTATSAKAVKNGTSYTITAPSAGANLVISLDNVTATGVYTLTTATRVATFTTSGKTYTTASNGGGNVTITAIGADKIEGTFFCEMFDGPSQAAIYASLGSGKFSATF